MRLILPFLSCDVTQIILFLSKLGGDDETTPFLTDVLSGGGVCQTVPLQSFENLQKWRLFFCPHV